MSSISYKSVVSFVLAISLAGCASVDMGDKQLDATLKTFTIPANKSAIYIYRNESMGGLVKMEVTVDGIPIGKTVAKTYLYKEVEPGKHIIVSKAENDSELAVDAKPGVLSYVWQEVKMGVLYARTLLHLVGEEEGKKGVSESALALTK